MLILDHAQDSVILDDGSQPELGSIFIYKTTMWSCLSGTACSHVVAKPAHVLELSIVVHLLRILQCHFNDLCCTFSSQAS